MSASYTNAIFSAWTLEERFTSMNQDDRHQWVPQCLYTLAF